MTPEPKRYCEDWQCPSRWGCELFFGRSYEYVAMVGGPGVDEFELFRGRATDLQADDCDDFQNATPKSWLKDFFTDAKARPV